MNEKPTDEHDWDYCSLHDCLRSQCWHEHRTHFEWVEFMAIAIALAMALVLLFSMRTP